MFLKSFALCIGAALLAGCSLTGDRTADQKPKPASAALTAEQKREQIGRFVKNINVALEEGRLNVAESLIVRLRYLDPENAEARLARGEILILKSRYSEAVKVFRGLTQLKEARARAYQGMGIANLQMGNSYVGSLELKKALAVNKELWRSWNGLGFYYDSLKNWHKAEESYSRALDIRKDRPTIFNNRGFSKLMQFKYSGALEDFNKALSLDSNLPAARMNIRLSYAWLGKYVEAIAGASKAEMPDVLNNVGYVAMLKGDFAAAEAYFSRAMELSPSFHETAAGNLRKLEVIRSRRQAAKTGKSG